MADPDGASGDGDGVFHDTTAMPNELSNYSDVPPPGGTDHGTEVVGKRSSLENGSQSQLSDSVSDGARCRRRRVAPYWHTTGDTRLETARAADGFSGWDDLPNGFMTAVFEVLHEQTNAHRLVMTCGLVCKSWHKDAVQTLLRDTAVSGRGARRFAKGRGLNDEADEAAVANKKLGDDAECSDDDKDSLRAQKNNPQVSESDASDEEFQSKRRKVVTKCSGGGTDANGATFGSENQPEDHAETSSKPFRGAISAGSHGHVR